jgi:hypothetical protein
LHEFREPRLVEWNFAALKSLEFALVNVDTDNMSARVSEACASD